ncbi:hypothetical protein TPCCA_1035a [Treponema paraluiscuniculi Cuniculi A]|uniref:Uncharacterized protein n=1 Tax=Treponema paraluiscuniculi (strain Cuniculi A) TaxID=545776 RepID=F7XRA3_TREPU|nr:hypothetical protein TPCCA_1035a [Treponema paraluiscuniculi Cuniculi A]
MKDYLLFRTGFLCIQKLWGGAAGSDGKKTCMYRIKNRTLFILSAVKWELNEL